MRKAATLLALLFTLTLSAQELEVSLQTISEPPAQLQYRVVVRNATGVDLQNVELDVSVWQFVRLEPVADGNWSCTNERPEHVRCRASVLANGATSTPVVIRVDPFGNDRTDLTAQAHWNLGDGIRRSSLAVTASANVARDFFVTNTRDAGPGSLRDAIEQANANCPPATVHCRILLRVEEPLPPSGWFTFRPLTPLPPLAAHDFALGPVRDHPAGRGYELDGSLLATGHGLEIVGEGMWRVEDLFVGGFPWDGVHVTRRGPHTTSRYNGSRIAQVSSGIRPDGSAHGNGSRGILFEAPASNAYVSGGRFEANRRSGMFIEGASRITTRHIWAHANGASGIYVGPASRDILIEASLAEDNPHFGVAIARGARGVKVENSIVRDNGVEDIDHALDGFSGHAFNGRHLPAPRLESWTYDPATDRTTITGTFDAPNDTEVWRLTMFRVRQLWPEGPLPTFQFTGRRFTLVVPGRFENDVFWAMVDAPNTPDWSTSEIGEFRSQ